MFRKINILPLLLAGTFFSTPTLADDYTLTLQMLQNATDPSKFTWEEMSSYTAPNENQGTLTIVPSSFEIQDIKEFKFTYLPENVNGYHFVSDLTSDTAGILNTYIENDSQTQPQLNADLVNAALYNHSNMGDINADIVGSNPPNAFVIENSGYATLLAIGNINGNIIGTRGILNGVAGWDADDNYTATIGDINSKLIAGNIADRQSSYRGNGGPGHGGFLSNENGIVGNITADHIINNYATTTNSQVLYGFMSGGAIYNSGNPNAYYAQISDNQPEFLCEGCMHPERADAPIRKQQFISTIGDIKAQIIGNGAWGYNASGGFLHNQWGQVGSINGDILGNYVKYLELTPPDEIQTLNEIAITNATESPEIDTRPTHMGGAIYNENGKIGTITSKNIKDNFAEGPIAQGGAIYNASSIEVQSDTYLSGYSQNTEYDDIGMKIDGSTFEGNYAHSTDDNAYGGAIYNETMLRQVLTNSGSSSLGDTENKTADEKIADMAASKAARALTLINTNFTNNHAVSDSGRAFGGAIYSAGDVNIIANNGKTSLFQGNTANDENNAIYMTRSNLNTQNWMANDIPEDTTFLSNLNLTATNNGVIQFDDAIDGEGYNINVSGDGTGVVKFNNLVKNVTNFTLGANSITHLGLNSKVYAQNMNVASSAIIQTSASSSPIITVDVEVDKANNTVNTGQIFVDNDIDGSYRVLVNSLNPDVLDNTEDAVVPFLFAPNDDENTDSSFSVARVIGSPYLWEGSVNAEGETEGSTWYLNLTDEENPDYDDGSGDTPEPTPVVKDYAPEVIAGIGLHEAAIEQTRSVVHNIKGKVAAGREFCPRCGMYDYGWDNSLLRNAWVLAQGESADIEKPIDMEAKIYAVEGGFDIQNDLHNTLGVFASYRKGEYDLSGKGKFRSSIGSEIDIDSYLAGLYYRYDRYLVWAFATLYGGVQKADVKTDDGIAKFDTDGIEFGASIEVGRTIPLANDLTLDPSVGLYYTQVNFDDADDNVGKHYEWDDIKHLEAELGAKLEKQFDNAKVYVKPSVIRTFTNGDSVVISGMNKANTYKDQTLGRVEIGGRYGFTDALSAYAWANYTFGSSYDAYALGAGLNYAW